MNLFGYVFENPTVEELYKQWIQDKLDRENIAPSTKDRYDRQVAECKSVGDFWGKKIRSVDEMEILMIGFKILTFKKPSKINTF